MNIFITLLFVTSQWVEFSSAGDCYGINSGVFYPGNDLRVHENTDLGGCCNLCKGTAGCKGYVWSKFWRRCALKYAIGPAQFDADRISGFPDNAINFDKTAQCSGVNSGWDITPLSNTITAFNSDVAGCCRACNAHPNCKAYVWGKILQRCWLKSVAGPRVAVDSKISGFKVAPIVPAPTTSTCGTTTDFENSSPVMQCQDECPKGDVASCNCCKSKGASGGKCFNGVPYCWPPIPVVQTPAPTTTTTCGTTTDFENSSPVMTCQDECPKGDAASCSCCKSKGAQGGKCFNGVPYCWPPVPV